MKKEKNNILNVYESGKVLRYHSNPVMARLFQTDADHAWGCAALLFVLHPSPSLELIKAAIFHDSGERWAGDMPAPAKWKNPKLAEDHATVEKELADEKGIPTFELDEEEENWLKFVDRLESHLLAFTLKPHMIREEGFPKQQTIIYQKAEELGCLEQLNEVLK